MKKLSDCFPLNNGVQIPCMGYGTFLTTDEETVIGVQNAIKAGYRHIDTAFYYNNEVPVGKAVRTCGLPREEIFVTSKIWNEDRGYQKTKDAFEITMKNLGLEYLDLLLIHWPANKKQFGDDAKTINAETWRAFEELYTEGRVKAIGLSNFLPHHIDELLETATVKPMVNQLEIHPGWTQTDAVNHCKKLDILVEAWSPLGRTGVLSNETLVALADKYHKSTAQLCIRWVLQQGILPLPKSAQENRIIANADIFDFHISEDDMTIISALEDIGGQCMDPDRVPF